ncbi:phosphohexomutase (phosphoglucomutase,phosphomannomutase) [Haladaptatus paucihalophilus DX253]|uniref:Phosphomannomutase n=1 Tax=Haladaptatus paucihalophilus DX253 TaxID=797209 RepID=E7QS48_HALPU|nr:phosphomannomutase [Haladaptatus paucihalophilus]EFW92817.1 phosphohexomutase (phosphoglucomutase,phosphomannomutase) [Haladaptatus paucihalophilus DX253]SHK11801.1 Phosphomannomutase [Haladaptatus paucihalophilus DX253]
MNLFGTAGIRGDVVERVTPELALAVGRAAGRQAEEFVVARDGRETGAALAAAMEAGLESAGATVRRAGQLPTPALAFASQGRRGVMLTASHNPSTDNGIKLFDDGQEYDRAAERAVETGVEDEEPPRPWDEWGKSTNEDVIDAYRDAVIEYAREYGAPLNGVRVAVDCGNGMASVATPQVLRALGATVISLNANVDGHFPGRPSKPTPETLTDLRSFVASDDFEFGLAHDGDADRIVLVNADGDVVHEDTVVALLAEHYTYASDAEDPVVVTTPNASARIDERVRAAGGRVERVRLGALHEGIAAALEEGDDGTEVVFAAEPWKHIHTQFGGWIDGVVSAAVLSRLIADAGGVEALRADVTERPYRKVSVDCPDAAKTGTMERVETAIPERFPDATVETEYGVRAERADGSWVLVRPSGTEPYVRIYAESETVDELVAETKDVVGNAVSAAKK